MGLYQTDHVWEQSWMLRKKTQFVGPAKSCGAGGDTIMECRVTAVRSKHVLSGDRWSGGRKAIKGAFAWQLDSSPLSIRLITRVEVLKHSDSPQRGLHKTCICILYIQGYLAFENKIHRFKIGTPKSTIWHTPKKNTVALVRERTIPIERPPLDGEVRLNFCG
jgi:hypothetical protein